MIRNSTVARPRGLAVLMHKAYAHASDVGATEAPAALRAEIAPHAPPAASKAVPPAPSSRGKVIVAGLAAAGLLWGVWATHAILGLQRGSNRLVKVELADLVREYVQAEARSGAAPDQITAQTAAFLKALNAAVAAHARAGEVVLLSNAVVDGAVPDITPTVRSEVYAHTARPQPGQLQGPSSQGTSVQSPALFQAQGGAGVRGK